MSPRSRRRIAWRWLGLAAVVLAILGVGAIRLNALGVGDEIDRVATRIRLIVDPPPDRPIEEAVLVTPRPSASPTPRPTATPRRSLGPGQTPPPAPTPTPTPARVKVDVRLPDDPKGAFISEEDHDWCAVAATQMVLAMYGKAPLTNAFQEKLAGRIDEWESIRDSKNGGWGPSAIVAALDAYGIRGYKVRAYETRQDAMADAARALSTLKAPVLLMAWHGAHTWVMTGYRADADPLLFDDPRVTGLYILDPWYPRVSSIWGASDEPGTFQDLSEMRRNYLPWKRPEGIYPKRDGLFIAVVPTEPRKP